MTHAWAPQHDAGSLLSPSLSPATELAHPCTGVTKINYLIPIMLVDLYWSITVHLTDRRDVGDTSPLRETCLSAWTITDLQPCH